MSLKILAIETATTACSTALYDDGAVVENFVIAPQQHTKLLLPMLDRMLAEAGITLSQLDAIAFGRGPGSFTGLRIAAGFAQGIAYGADLPVIPVSTLQAMAQGACRCFKHTHVLVALDARKDEVYWNEYKLDKQIMQPMQEEQLSKPEKLLLPEGGNWSGIGDGWKVYAECFAQKLDNKPNKIETGICPQAQDVAVLAAELFQTGQAVPPDQALPVYLRDNI